MNKPAVSWKAAVISDGLHQAIEAKENVKIEAATQTYATDYPAELFPYVSQTWPV